MVGAAGCWTGACSRVDFRALTPLDRLAFVGTLGMGALSYRPEHSLDPVAEGEIDLDWLADQAALAEREVDAADIELLSATQGGSSGARPKIVAGLHSGTDKIRADLGGPLPDGFEPWIVKFRSIEDPQEIGPEEYAYSLMAAAAGVVMPETRLIATRRGNATSPRGGSTARRAVAFTSIPPAACWRSTIGCRRSTMTGC